MAKFIVIGKDTINIEDIARYTPAGDNHVFVQYVSAVTCTNILDVNKETLDALIRHTLDGNKSMVSLDYFNSLFND